MIPFTALGLPALDSPLAQWLIQQGIRHAPKLLEFLGDAGGHLSRVGDLLVWNGEKGASVIATLESLHESQARIEGVVRNIEATQLVMSNALGTIHNLSMATLGVTSLTGIFMLHRFRALNQRLDQLSSQLQDIQNHLDAQTHAHLRSATDFLNNYESGKRRDADLRRSLEASNYAANVYSELASREIGDQKRPAMLSYVARCHVLSLLVEVRCLILSEDLEQAVYRLDSELETAVKGASALYDKCVWGRLKEFLDPAYACDGVTLRLITELYQQGQTAHVVVRRKPVIADEAEMFEYLRMKNHGAKRTKMWSWRSSADDRQSAVVGLKFTMAAIEEVNRLKTLRLRIQHALDHGYTMSDFEDLVHGQAKNGTSTGEDPVCVMAFDDPFGADAFVPSRLAERIEWLRQQAQVGNTEAQNELGYRYEMGEGLDVDYAEAARWYRVAADQGDAAAQSNLGRLCLTGEGVPRDVREAVRWYRMAAEQGDVQSQVNLGITYMQGDGVSKDAHESARWFRAAAEQGDAQAQWNMGVVYQNGEGMPQDVHEAVRWFKAAADQGFGLAEWSLACCYEEGDGVRQDCKEAMRLYESALQHGDHNATGSIAWHLATCPYDGCRNGREAVELATKACEASDWQDDGDLDTLAAAHAECGDYESACKWQEEAIARLPDRESQEDIESRLALYRSKRPYRSTWGRNEASDG